MYEICSYYRYFVRYCQYLLYNFRFDVHYVQCKRANMLILTKRYRHPALHSRWMPVFLDSVCLLQKLDSHLGKGFYGFRVCLLVANHHVYISGLSKGVRRNPSHLAGVHQDHRLF